MHTIQNGRLATVFQRRAKVTLPDIST